GLSVLCRMVGGLVVIADEQGLAVGTEGFPIGTVAPELGVLYLVHEVNLGAGRREVPSLRGDAKSLANVGIVLPIARGHLRPVREDGVRRRHGRFALDTLPDHSV